MEQSNGLACAYYALFIVAAGYFVLHYSFNWGDTDDFLLIDWYAKAIVRKEMTLWEFVTIADNSHLLAAQAAVSWVLFYIFGINFKVLVYLSSALLLVGSVMLTALLWPGLRGRTAKSLALAIPVTVMFHPVQIHALLWAFEIGWFMVTFLLIANIFILEKFGQRGLPWVLAGCVVVNFCSAHGLFLWLAASLQVSLRPGLRHRSAWVVAFLAGFFLGGLALSTLTSAESGGIRQGSIQLSDLQPIVSETVQLLGSVFGTRVPEALIALGIVGLVLTVGLCWSALAKPALRPSERAGIVLIFTSFLFIAAFSLGRFRYGVPWAIAEYHAGPLPVPLLCGLSILGIQAFDDQPARGWMPCWAALIPCAFCVGSVVAFLPQASQLGREALVRRAMAMHESCAPDTPRFLLERLNGLVWYPDLMDRTLPIARRLCTTVEPELARNFETKPKLFATLAAAQPADAQALADLWNVYRTHLDLMRAFPIKSPQMPDLLLKFASNDALGGSKYDPALLGPHRDTFIRLGASR